MVGIVNWRRYIKQHTGLAPVPLPEVAQMQQLVLAQCIVLAAVDMPRPQQFDE